MNDTFAPDVLPVSDAAEAKGCTGQTIRNAIERGELNAVRPGPRATLVVQDAAFGAYAPQETGGRLHKGSARQPGSRPQRAADSA
jgi:hypothetical protein